MRSQGAREPQCMPLFGLVFDLHIVNLASQPLLKFVFKPRKQQVAFTLLLNLVFIC